MSMSVVSSSLVCLEYYVIRKNMNKYTHFKYVEESHYIACLKKVIVCLKMNIIIQIRLCLCVVTDYLEINT